MTNPASNNFIWALAPASDWAESYPLGDGKIGAMVRGNTTDEVIHLNHGLLWRNYIKKTHEYHTYKDMPQIRSLCLEKKWKEANELMLKTLPTENSIYINPFIPAFDLYITLFKNNENVSNYKRTLDMENGIVTVKFEIDGIRYCRESFCSQELGAFVTRLTTSVPGTLSGEVSLSRMGDCECEDTGLAGYDFVTTDCTLEEGLRFSGRTKLINRNGRLTGGKKTYGTDHDEVSEKKLGLGYVFDRDMRIDSKKGASVVFDSCDELFVITAISVEPESDNPSLDAEKICNNSANGFSYSDIKKSHTERFSKYYNSTTLCLDDENKEMKQTPELLSDDIKNNEFSPELCNLIWNMSRYVAIASGMNTKTDDTLCAPINLQGIWNRDLRPAWESDYHPDLNIQMCYWPMPALGLTDLMEKYLLWMERLLPSAKLRARDIFGARGADFNGCSDYKVIGAVDHVAGLSIGSTAWFCQILWIYYEHKPSKALLKRIYRIMKEVSLFFEDILTEDENGMLTTAFGTSPEMGLVIDGKTQWLSSPSTYDVTLIREFYTNFRTASKILKSVEGIKTAEKILAKLIQPVIKDDGMVAEWTENHEEADPGHRHRSPFVAFCPGTLYTVENSPEFTSGLGQLLKKREEYMATGLSIAFAYIWDAQILARLYDGNSAYEFLKTLCTKHVLKNLFFTINEWNSADKTAWFNGVKVFQVESMIGYGAAVSEMFYQDRDGIIRILPALPDRFSSGSMHGIQGRYGTKCNLSWKDKKITSMELSSDYNKTCNVRLPENATAMTVTINEKTIKTVKDGRICSFKAKKNKTYQISFTY